MHLIDSYRDLQRAEVVIQEQIRLTKHEIYEWYGIDMDTDEGVAFDSKFAKRFGMNVALQQNEYVFNYLENLERRLENIQTKMKHINEGIEKFESLDYKIAFKRIIEEKSHKEIALELNYTEQYVRSRWSKINKKIAI